MKNLVCVTIAAASSDDRTRDRRRARDGKKRRRRENKAEAAAALPDGNQIVGKVALVFAETSSTRANKDAEIKTPFGLIDPATHEPFREKCRCGLNERCLK